MLTGPLLLLALQIKEVWTGKLNLLPGVCSIYLANENPPATRPQQEERGITHCYPG